MFKEKLYFVKELEDKFREEWSKSDEIKEKYPNGMDDFHKWLDSESLYIVRLLEKDDEGGYYQLPYTGYYPNLESFLLLNVSSDNPFDHEDHEFAATKINGDFGDLEEGMKFAHVTRFMQGKRRLPARRIMELEKTEEDNQYLNIYAKTVAEYCMPKIQEEE